MADFQLANDPQKPAFWKGPPKQKPPVQKMFISGLNLDKGQADLFDTEGIPQETFHAEEHSPTDNC